MSDKRECLHCGETKESIAANNIDICCTVSGYEYVEIDDEWPRHRWVDWTKKELAKFGVTPSDFPLYRRTNVNHIQWIACDDTVKGHHPLDAAGAATFEMKVGQCLLCGHLPTPAPIGDPE